jgi:hypothetical protein
MLYHLHRQPPFGWRITLLPLLDLPVRGALNRVPFRLALTTATARNSQ